MSAAMCVTEASEAPENSCERVALMKRICAIIIVIMFLIIVPDSALGASRDTVKIKVNGTTVRFSWKPVIIDGVTMADVREVASAIGVKCNWYPKLVSATVKDSNTGICITAGEECMTVTDLTGTSTTEYNFFDLLHEAYIDGGRLIAPVRDVVTVFGYWLNFDQETMTVNILNTSVYSKEKKQANVSLSGQDNTYYFQNQTEFSLPGFGSGYCWVCSYAMVLTDLTGKSITPTDVAEVNLTRTSDGAYCYHYDIAQEFGVRFVPAVSKNSQYYGGFDSGVGATFIANPEKSDEVASAAIREALAQHPEGIMVRYSSFPHTMVAVGFSGDTVYFNDPAYTSSAKYATKGSYNCVPFENTCVAAKGFKLADLTYIQALSLK